MTVTDLLAPTDTTQMTEAQFDAWVEALRSGNFEQGEGSLCDSRGRYCCLGVFAKINGLDMDANAGDIETESRSWDPHERVGNLTGLYGDQVPVSLLVLSSTTRSTLADANDGGASFEDIADALERNRARILAGDVLGSYDLFGEEE